MLAQANDGVKDLGTAYAVSLLPASLIDEDLTLSDDRIALDQRIA